MWQDNGCAKRKGLFQSYKNIYLTGFNQCTIAQIRIKLTADEMT